MGSSARAAASRRKFLQFLAGSPLLAGAASRVFAGEALSPGTKLPDPLAWAPMESGEDALRRVREHGDRQMTQTE